MADAGARARVERALDVAARIADAQDPLGRHAREALLALGELSAEGIALALERHLEVAATDAEFESFLGSAGQAPRTAILLSANVCTAALRAIAFGLATSSTVIVKPSRRDPVLAELLAAELPGVSVVSSFDEALLALDEGDELHAYGSDETLAAIAERAADRGVVLRAHGTGFGVAAIEAGADLATAATALSASLVAFDGRGCLSPRLAFVDGDDAVAHAFAEHLHVALTRRGQEIPRGPLDPAELAELALYRRSLALVGEVFDSPHHLVAFDPAPDAVAPAPAHRAVLVVPASGARVATLMKPWGRFVTQVGATSRGALVHALTSAAPSARVSALETMQTPPFDGPVDLRAGARPQATGTNTRSR